MYLALSPSKARTYEYVGALFARSVYLHVIALQEHGTSVSSV
jgi:hypothetical protein